MFNDGRSRQKRRAYRFIIVIDGRTRDPVREEHPDVYVSAVDSKSFGRYARSIREKIAAAKESRGRGRRISIANPARRRSPISREKRDTLRAAVAN